VKFPNNTQRHFIVGATGSGKTHMAVWSLSMRNYDVMPWIVYDFKTDELINSIDGAQYLDIDAPLPEHPGIYIVQPDPDDDEILSEHMKLVWAQTNIGVFIDEGYMVGKNNKGFRRLLTQGRSRRIPMIILSQRPVWMDRFVLSESEFKQVFRLSHIKDVKTVQEFIPYNITKRLPEFYSYYYDVTSNTCEIMPPAPPMDEIIRNFHIKLRRLKQVV
jgi:hypothetical protein